jgi:hypothetical protein
MDTVFRGSSYYSRVILPTDLCGTLQRREILNTLQSTIYRDTNGQARYGKGSLNFSMLAISCKMAFNARAKSSIDCLDMAQMFNCAKQVMSDLQSHPLI